VSSEEGNTGVSNSNANTAVDQTNYFEECIEELLKSESEGEDNT
jgi:hypothetical protein